jgi:hypothetical protein
VLNKNVNRMRPPHDQNNIVSRSHSVGPVSEKVTLRKLIPLLRYATICFSRFRRRQKVIHQLAPPRKEYTSTTMNMNCSPPTVQRHLREESRCDSFLQISSPKRKEALGKIKLKGCLKKPLDTRSVNKLASMFEKDKACKQKKAVKFASAVEYAPPTSDKEAEYAAIDIQRIARGGWQRLMFKIALLQQKLDTHGERTAASIQRIKDRTQQRKDKLRRQIMKQEKAVLKRSAQESTLAEESHKIVEFLRKENNKLRNKNEKIYKAIQALKKDNARLENANIATDEHFSTLGDQAKQIEEMHSKLKTIIPMYESSVEDMREAVEMRRQLCLSEHKIKLTYTKAIGTAVEMMEDRCKDTDLVDEIFEYCLSNEGEEKTAPPPPKLGQFFEESREESDSSDGAEYDEYTVVTMD